MSEPKYFVNAWSPEATHKLDPETLQIVPIPEEEKVKRPLGLLGNNIVSLETISGTMGEEDATSKGTDSGADSGVSSTKPGEVDQASCEEGET